nr:hypothetical protein [uncultured Methanoregula sp.]
MPKDPGRTPTILNDNSDPSLASAHARPQDDVIIFSESSKGQESGNVTGKLEELVETSFAAPLERNFIKSDGTARVRIIAPGWGSSGYYPESMLKRDASEVYVPTTHQYIDHPTKTEEKERPERSLKDLAAVITGNVKYEADAPIPGVYADIKVFKQFREFLNEKAPYIGVSHRAIGKGVSGEAEGRQGKIIESLHKCLSVDFVTKPGAGGGIMPMYEAYRKNSESLTENASPAENEPRIEQETHNETIEDIMVNEKETTVLTVESLRETRPDLYTKVKESVLQEIQASEAHKLQESEQKKILKENQDMKVELERLREAQVFQEAGRIVGKALEKSTLPQITKDRLKESLPKLATIKEGKLDETAFNEALTTAIKTETDYVAKLTESGKPKGMGGPAGASTGSGDSKTRLKESFKQSYIRQGKSAKEAETLAEIAASGR